MRSAIALTLIVLAAACGPQPVTTDRVRIFDTVGRPESEWGYDPKEIRVASGTTVTFTNAGVVFHTVTSDGAVRLFDLSVNAGETGTLEFDTAGTFPYHCGVHPDMKGVVHVCDGQCR